MGRITVLRLRTRLVNSGSRRFIAIGRQGENALRRSGFDAARSWTGADPATGGASIDRSVMVVTGRRHDKRHLPVLGLEVGLHAMTGDLLYFAAFALLAALIVVPAALLIHRSSPKRRARGWYPAFRRDQSDHKEFI